MDVMNLLSILVMFMPTKGKVFCSAISMVNFKLLWQEINLLRKNVSLVEVRHNGQGVIYVALIEGGELILRCCSLRT